MVLHTHGFQLVHHDLRPLGRILDVVRFIAGLVGMSDNIDIEFWPVHLADGVAG